ncbi:hypothetical protein BD410DRAFT_86683 [Rickenella mellea]|uniref:G domain-containing protein n=1 Tax=Rickenella mellea TaxID=50990 RepID=A0A4Y7PLA1_9AGAM|nr:hypothetical protein BD410DRAFT_86683 [Rickenella mellea]
MANPSLTSTAEEFFKECPRFRILTSGKTGVGKTTLIKHAFKVDHIQGSDKEPGKCDINDEIHSSENIRFVLHDSQGFEPGETENFNEVKNFIQQRAQEPEIRDQLHAIWLCIKIPEAGGRLIEYDRLYNYTRYQMRSQLRHLSKEEQKKPVEQETEKYFKVECVDRLNQLNHRPKKLEWTTYNLVRNHVAESVWVASATAQRVNVDLNVESSIRVGIKKYWRGLASSINFPGNLLRDCLSIIHKDIVKIWNFLDPDTILEGNEIKAMILGLVQDLADPDASNPNSGFSENLKTIKASLDVATPISGPIAPVVATIGLSVMFVNWLFGLYTNTPGTLRSLMGYIVDLTIVLEQLFWFKAAQPKNPAVSSDDVKAVFGLYSNSEERVQVHREIRAYVDNMSLLDHAHPDNAHEEVERLIKVHRLDLFGANKPAGGASR